MTEHSLTSDERAAFQSMVARGVDPTVAQEIALDGVTVDEVRRSSPYPRRVPPTLDVKVTEGHLHLQENAAYLRAVRRALVTGGRSLLQPVPGRPFRDGTDHVAIRLTPEIERRIRTSGGTLTEEEIRTGMEQLRESDEDMLLVELTETREAITDGVLYATSQMLKALTESDERALHQSWEMARKVINLRKRLAVLEEKAAAPVSVVTGAAPTGHGPEKDDDSAGQLGQTLPMEGSEA